MEKKFLSIGETAARLGVHYTTVNRWVITGQLPALKIGKLYRISEAELANVTQPIAPAPASDTTITITHPFGKLYVSLDAILLGVEPNEGLSPEDSRAFRKFKDLLSLLTEEDMRREGLSLLTAEDQEVK